MRIESVVGIFKSNVCYSDSSFVCLVGEHVRFDMFVSAFYMFCNCTDFLRKAILLKQNEQYNALSKLIYHIVIGIK